MVLDDLSKYGNKYPSLCLDIWNFFHDTTIPSMFCDGLKHALGDGIAAKTTKSSLDFASNFAKQYKDIDNDNVMIQPIVVSKICDILCDNNMLNKMNVSGFNLSYGENFYCGNLGKEQIPNTVYAQRFFNNLVYGFKYIYEANKANVLPVHVLKEVANEKGEIEEKEFIGTCFKSEHGIVTAKHCIANCKKVKIESIRANILNDSTILSQDGIDIVVIIPDAANYDSSSTLELERGEILDSVMSMGHPKHAGFGNFLTATTGQIAAIETSYLCPKHTLMLLTGKIKGGNSGGPVLNKNGKVIAVITDTDASEGDYDKFGYGMAIPSEYIEKILQDRTEYSEKINFVDEI